MYYGKPLQRRDYLGPYQYEQDSLRFFPHAEGWVLWVVAYDATRQLTVNYAREFSFQDHLGNLRLAYRLEPSAHGRESQQFDSLLVSAPLAVPTSQARTGTYAARLHAGGDAPRLLGPTLQLAVQQGDTVTAHCLYLWPRCRSSKK